MTTFERANDFCRSLSSPQRMGSVNCSHLQKVLLAKKIENIHKFADRPHLVTRLIVFSSTIFFRGSGTAIKNPAILTGRPHIWSRDELFPHKLLSRLRIVFSLTPNSFGGSGSAIKKQTTLKECPRLVTRRISSQLFFWGSDLETNISSRKSS
jgi:hypothetical protein